MAGAEEIWGWGWSGFGQSGTPSSGEVDSPTPIFFGSGSDGAEPIRIVSLAGGSFHSAACDSSGDLYTWGNGRQGQLGHGGGERAGSNSSSGENEEESRPRLVTGATVMHDFVSVGCGGSHTIAVTNEGTLHAYE